MRTLPSVTMMCLAAALSAAARPAAPAPTHTVDPGRTLVEQKEYVFKAEDAIFTGTVVTNDLKGKTITILGHNPLRRETVERLVPRDQLGRGRLSDRPPLVQDAPQVFHVDAVCRVAIANKPAAHLADIKAGDIVDVDFRKMADSSIVASAILTADKHPYDPPPAKAATKK